MGACFVNPCARGAAETPGGNPTCGEQSPKAELSAIRFHTCYPEFRGKAGLLASLSFIVVAAIAGFHAVVGFRNQNEFFILIGLTVAILGCFLVFVAKQALLLLADIADILIEQNRRKRSTDDAIDS